MAKITRGSSEVHPEGWFRFCIKGNEPIQGEYKGRKTDRIKFTCESTERREDGTRFLLNLFTGTVLSTHEACKLTQLVEACGIDVDEFEDTDELDGAVFAGKVKHSETGYANIADFDTKDRVETKKAKSAEKAKPAKKAKDAEEDDPFADE